MRALPNVNLLLTQCSIFSIARLANSHKLCRKCAFAVFGNHLWQRRWPMYRATSPGLGADISTTHTSIADPASGCAPCTGFLLHVRRARRRFSSRSSPNVRRGRAADDREPGCDLCHSHQRDAVAVDDSARMLDLGAEGFMRLCGRVADSRLPQFQSGRGGTRSVR